MIQRHGICWGMLLCTLASALSIEHLHLRRPRLQPRHVFGNGESRPVAVIILRLGLNGRCPTPVPLVLKDAKLPPPALTLLLVPNQLSRLSPHRDPALHHLHSFENQPM